MSERALGWCSLLLLCACTDEVIDPLPQPSASPPAPTGTVSAERVREVYVRNPLGAPPDNLLADGDFELSVTDGAIGQYGFVAFGQQGPRALTVETGGLCKSGLLCARMAAGEALLGQGTAAPDRQAHHASVWVKPLHGDAGPSACAAAAEAYAVQCAYPYDVLNQLQPAAAPDELGYCQLEGAVEPSLRGVCLLIVVGESEVLVDHAVLAPAPGRSPPRPAPVVPEATKQRFRAIAEHVRRSRRFGQPAPAPERRQD